MIRGPTRDPLGINRSQSGGTLKGSIGINMKVPLGRGAGGLKINRF